MASGTSSVGCFLRSPWPAHPEPAVLYMSPEQAMARRVPVDHRTDVYSLGASLYEALTWNPPFRGKNHHDTLSQIIFREPRPLRQRNPRIPRDLETIVLKCLHKDPRDRYGTAEALAQDLRCFARGDPIEARPLPPCERVARRAWKRKGLVAASVIVALFLVTAGLLLKKHGDDQYLRLDELYGRKVLRSSACNRPG